MPDEFFSQTPPPSLARPSRRGGGGVILLALVVAFLLGAAGVGYTVWKGLLPIARPAPAPQKLATPAVAPAPAPAGTRIAPAADPASLAAQQSQLEARTAALAARLDTLTLQADAAAGNATRAEALLVAFATRRALDRGAPLNTLEDQLRLRFGDSQPHAVATVIDAAREPVTLDQLVAGLDGLAPSLTETPSDGGAWARMRRELSALFVIRRQDTPSPAPQAMLRRARILLESGRTEEAIGEVQHLPGASGAADWFTAARRYDDARRALDVLETSAMIGTPAQRAATRAAQPTGPAPEPSAAATPAI